MTNPGLNHLIGLLVEHEEKLNRSFSLIPSENALSPLARAAFFSDAFSRYFFNEREVFGRWSFQGGSIAGRIQTEVVVPLLRRLGRAEFVNVHPVSGLTGMTLALAAFGGEPGSTVLSVPVDRGGHPDTGYVAAKLGYRVHPLPFPHWRSVDLEALSALVERTNATLVYVDHATALVPLDLPGLIGAVRAAGRGTHVHVDTSHVNGLVWGGVLPNPLDCGADSYGGSTHKTFPGPHKAVLFTNSPELDERLTLTAVNMISHHHLASVIALGIALLEFEDCGGRTYAAQVVANARAFARSLSEAGVPVEGEPPHLTSTHQVWATGRGADPYATAATLFEAGLVVNPYNPLPSTGAAGIRMGVNEATRLGLREEGMTVLARVYERAAHDPGAASLLAEEVGELRRSVEPEYCFKGDEAISALSAFAGALVDERRRYFGPLAVASHPEN
jgi:glycine hydroxymethyltransferase